MENRKKRNAGTSVLHFVKACATKGVNNGNRLVTGYISIGIDFIFRTRHSVCMERPSRHHMQIDDERAASAVCVSRFKRVKYVCRRFDRTRLLIVFAFFRIMPLASSRQIQTRTHRIKGIMLLCVCVCAQNNAQFIALRTQPNHTKSVHLFK